VFSLDSAPLLPVLYMYVSPMFNVHGSPPYIG
jgi:hypothetical protein